MVVSTPADVMVDELWEEFGRVRASGDKARAQDLRNQLLVYYAPLTKYVASRVASGLPQSVQQEDLVSFGWFGLINAVERFDPAREIKFETYAMPRIRGAILDELRKSDWVPRSVRQKARAIEKSMGKLEGRNGRSATDDELADDLGWSMPQLHKTLTEIHHAGVIALDDVVGHAGGGNEGAVTLIDTITDGTEDPVHEYEKREMRGLLADAINAMSAREKWVLMLYYYERFTLAEIGRILSVTESRVCQIHTKAVLQLSVTLKRRMS